MSDNKNNLYIYEAIELRNEFDKHSKILENLIDEKRERKGFFSSREEDELQPSKDFNIESIQEKLKKLQTKRVKLNRELQLANLKSKFNYDGTEVSLSEALEIKKNLLKDIDVFTNRLTESAYVKVIHKEGRDIIKEPKQKFNDAYQSYENLLKKLRFLNQEIHKINHTEVINFKDE
ncbi:MAG: hypothetical protein AB1498_04985 [bacterium]